MQTLTNKVQQHFCGVRSVPEQLNSKTIHNSADILISNEINYRRNDRPVLILQQKEP